MSGCAVEHLLQQGVGHRPLVLSFAIHMHQHAGRHVEQRAVGETQAVAAGERALHRQGETVLRIEPVQRTSLAVKHQAQRAGQRWMGAGDRRQRFVEQGDIVTRQLADLNHTQPFQIGLRADKAAHELARRVGQNTVGGIKLRQHAAFLENGDFIAEADRFIDVVGH